MAISFNNIRKFNANDGTVNQSSNIYYVLNSGPTYTTRSLAAADMFTDTAVTGDYLLFRRLNGCSKPGGVRVDISTAMVSATGHTITWEYRLADGTWAAFAGVVDGTTNFTTTGLNSVTWTMPSDWGTNATSVNGSIGNIWFRARLTVNTTLSEGGATAATIWDIYDYSVRVDANHVFDSGTATSGTAATLTDTGKAWAVDSLRNRIIRIHTGTGAGNNLVIKSNTATVITFIDTAWTADATAELALDNTSQYTICANFEDLYQADVAGGWGVITKAGNHSYAFNCFLNIDAGAFGDVLTNVEFLDNFYFYCTGASTNVYPFILGWRLPKMYGLDKAIMGNTIISNRVHSLDNRGYGFTTATEFAFSGGNKFILRPDYANVAASGYLRAWFANYHKESIGDTFEGWRSVLYPKSTSPRTEVRGLIVQDGYSGIEVPLAAFNGVDSVYNTGLGIYLTSSNAANATGFNVTGMNNVNGNRFASGVQFYQLAVDATVTDYLGVRNRPMSDVFSGAGTTGSAIIKNTLRATITDEQGNLLSNAKVQISDSLAQNKKTYLNFDGANDWITVPNNATGNQLYQATSYSIEAWVWCRTTGGGTLGRIVDKGGTSGFYLHNNAGSFRFSAYIGGSVKNSNSISAIAGSWHHVVGVWDGATIKLYVDNVTAAGTAAVGATANESAQTQYIGNNSGATNGHDGFIRRLRIFRNKALSASDYASLWNNGNYVQNEICPVSGCTAEYNFTEGTGTTIADTSGNGVTGTLGASTAAPTWIDTNANDTSNAITTNTGTEGAYMPATALTDATRYSLTNQPASPTRLRIKVVDFRDTQSSAAVPARVELSGTDVDDFVINESVYFEEFRNGEFLTKLEFKTVVASGVYMRGMSGTVTIDNLGVIPPQTIKCQRWRSVGDVSLNLTDFNPIIIKVSRPGFEPVVIKKSMYEPIDDVIVLKRSALDLT